MAGEVTVTLADPCSHLTCNLVTWLTWHPGLVITEKVGRVRSCRLGPHQLEEETAWIATYQEMLEGRVNRLGEFLERTKGEKS